MWWQAQQRSLILLAVILLLIAGPGNERLVALLSLVGAILWTLVYRLVMLALRRAAKKPQRVVISQPQDANTQGTTGDKPIGAPSLPQPTLTQEESVLQREVLLRYGIAVIAVGLALLGLVLILIQYNLNYPFLAVAPLTLLFPFSYLAYVAFQRSVRVERLKRDFILMDTRWDEDLYQQSQGFWNFALHIMLAVLMTFVGVTISLLPTSQLPGVSPDLLNDAVLQAMRFGFIGGYLFSMQLIYRRYTTYDLQPSVYMYCALTILGGLAFNYVSFQAIAAIAGSPDAAQATGIGGGLFAILAFALGFFPLMAVQWLTRIAYSALGMSNRRSEDLPLSLIDGISQLHETRLRDHGIDNVQNLASADLPFLLINTTFNAPEVLDWVDQAILYLYLAPSDIESFRRGRVRTISDFRDMWHNCYPIPLGLSDADKEDFNQMRTERALQLQSTPDQLDLLYRTTERGPNLYHIMNYWQNSELATLDFYNLQYNALLQEVLFLPDDDQETLEERQKLADAFCRESNAKVTASNGQSLAGLGRLTMEQCIADPVKRQNVIEEAIKHYSDALKLNDRVNGQVINDLKFLTDVQMGMVDDEVKQADTAKAANDAAGEKTHLDKAIALATSAITTSRLFYDNGSCNISYLSWLASLKERAGDRDEAQEMFKDARELAEAIPHFDPGLLERIKKGAHELEVEGKKAAKASSSSTAAAAATATATADTKTTSTNNGAGGQSAGGQSAGG